MVSGFPRILLLPPPSPLTPADGAAPPPPFSPRPLSYLWHLLLPIIALSFIYHAHVTHTKMPRLRFALSLRPHCHRAAWAGSGLQGLRVWGRVQGGGLGIQVDKTSHRLSSAHEMFWGYFGGLERLRADSFLQSPATASARFWCEDTSTSHV